MDLNLDDKTQTAVDRLTEYCERAKRDPAKRSALSLNPLGVLRNLNIEVEEEFSQAVSDQLNELATSIEVPTGDAETPAFVDFAAEDLQPLPAGPAAPAGFTVNGSQPAPAKPKASPPAPPMNLRIVEEKPAQEVPDEVIKSLEFMVKPWGLVLAVHQPAMGYLKGGGTITGTVLAALSPIPILGWASAFFAFFIGINLGVIEMTDRGKGVYLSVTWAHILLCGVGTLVPIITPIK